MIWNAYSLKGDKESRSERVNWVVMPQAVSKSLRIRLRGVGSVNDLFIRKWKKIFSAVAGTTLLAQSVTGTPHRLMTLLKRKGTGWLRVTYVWLRCSWDMPCPLNSAVFSSACPAGMRPVPTQHQIVPGIRELSYRQRLIPAHHPSGSQKQSHEHCRYYVIWQYGSIRIYI